ncbi:General transcription factor IIH subunit 3 [Paragonimus heterotremus]|uniref:General transcription factor IIH subunit 3 n=1 Tax=Paragonimus heterotremus TaxID=100268 RepID=A0A8J4WF69_9TREM|nr:General transcription factor IIH subunit 3 [Paragonimus heterotremus]
MSRGDQNSEINSRSLIVIVLDMTPAWWGLCGNEDMSLPNCIEAVLGFANVHQMFSPFNELAILGVTPETTRFLWPVSTSRLKSQVEAPHDGQQYQLGCMNDAVRQQALELINSSSSCATNVILSGAVLKGLCYYLRRCRELQPTRNNTDEEQLSFIEHIECSDATDKISARILVIKAADDNPSQYLSLMNAVFTAQKLHVPIDTCVLPLFRPSEPSIALDGNTYNKQIRHSSLFHQATDLTGGIYLHIPGRKGLLQYLLSVFLPSPALRPKLLLPDIRSSDLNPGVDFRAACFCHRRLIDIGYVCSVCLSVFCEFTPLCATCGSPFAVPTVQTQ